MFKTRTRGGFTLIELLVVIAIIGILSSVVLASLNSAREKSRDAKRISDLKQLQLAAELFYDDFGSYPNATEFAATSGTAGTRAAGLVGNGFIASLPSDPSDQSAYTYEQIDSGADYVIRATLENVNHSALDSDVDGSVGTGPVDCADGSGYYCVQP